MRSASSYRAGRKKIAKEVGIPLAKVNLAFDVAARAAEAAPPAEAQEAARRKLAIWAANGGRETAVSPAVTDPVLKRMNKAAVVATLETTPAAVPIEPPVPATVERATEAAKKITAEDVDKALEKALTNWQAAQHQEPLPLSKLFAARARTLGWAEDVEFREVD